MAESCCNKACIVQGEKYRFSVLTPFMMRMEYSETGVFEDLQTQTVLNREFPVGALTAIGAVAYKIIKWFQAQEKQTTDIEDLKKQEKEDIKAMEDELCLLTYAVLACLKGLKEQGCNGPVTEAIGKIEKHINQKAHGQET